MRELNEVDIPWVTVRQIMAVIRKEHPYRRQYAMEALYEDAMRAADAAIKVRDSQF